MAATSTPYGAQVVSDQAGIVRPVRMPLGIASGYAANIFKFQPVKLVNGLDPGGAPIQEARRTRSSASSMASSTRRLGGRPAVSPFWPSGTTYDSTQQMFVYFTPAWLPSFRVRIQADGSVAQALMGSQFNFTQPRRRHHLHRPVAVHGRRRRCRLADRRASSP